MRVEQGRVAGRTTVVPDQFGADHVEAVLGDTATVLEAEDRVELVVRRGRAQAARGQRPLAQRGALLV